MNLFSKSNLSLMNKIILAFVAYVTSILLIFCLIVLLIDRGQVKSVSDTYSQTILNDKKVITEQWLEERKVDLQVLALTNEIKSMNEEDGIRLLKEAAQYHQNIYARYYIIDTKGQVKDTLGIVSQGEKSYDFTSDQAIITASRYDETFKQPTIELMVPIIEDGQAVGVLGATILLKALVEELSLDDHSSLGYGWIVSEEGQVISHNEESQIGLFLTSTSDDGEFDALLGQMIEKQRGTASFVNKEGEKEYVLFDRVTEGSDWFVCVSLYQSEVYRTTPVLIRNLTFIFIVFVLLSSVVSWILAKDITKPIESLIDVTTKFTTGIKGIRANIESKDEIGILAQSFNNMADTIVAHTDNLEEMIKERTSTLADLNYQIVSRNKELGTMNEELEKTNNKLHELASTDMLTGLYNRHQFQRDLQKTMELVNAGREENFALLFIDLDNFKYYNDAFGHEIGDFLLQTISDILMGNVRGNDLVGRYGGDEFVILLREGDYEVAKTIAERIHQTILGRDGFKKELQRKLNADVKILGKNKLSSSIGIIKYMKSMNITDCELLLAKADETMYKAKKAGKSRVVVG